MRILLTGAAGFIGYHTSQKLLKAGHEVFGYDSVNDYYNPRIKEDRLEQLSKHEGFQLQRAKLEDGPTLTKAYESFKPDRVLHLAAQAGVRYSLENPTAYIDANIIGFQNMIELVRKHKPENFVYASSSSVYGGLTEYPFSEEQNINQPVSLYAATKASNELVAKAYSHLYDIPTTGLRFFTVYGPISRPDMALYKFARLMKRGETIPVFNDGKMVRDFTYVDDIVNGIIAALDKPQLGAVYNLGRGEPMQLMEMIELLERHLGIKAKKEMLPMQMGDVPKTVADISKARTDLGYEPKVSLSEGVARFCEWFKEHAESDIFE